MGQNEGQNQDGHSRNINKSNNQGGKTRGKVWVKNKSYNFKSDNKETKAKRGKTCEPIKDQN